MIVRYFQYCWGAQGQSHLVLERKEKKVPKTNYIVNLKSSKNHVVKSLWNITESKIRKTMVADVYLQQLYPY